MNTTHELDSRLAAFYATESHSKAPDRVLVNALTAIESTPQRHALALAPWRFRPMNVYAKLAGAAVAIIALAVFAGVWLQPNTGNAGASGSPPATATPSAVVPSSIPSPNVTPGPTSVAAIPLPHGHPPVALAAGRYSIPVPGSNVSVELTIGETGWMVVGDSSSIFRSKLAVSFGTVTNVYTDACLDSSLPHPAIGPSVDDLVTALDAQKNTVMEQRSSTFVSGHPSTRFVMRPSDGIRNHCTVFPVLWRTQFANGSEVVDMNWSTAPGGVEEVFRAVDVDGTRIVITASYRPSDPSQSALIQRMIDSIEFVRS
jgi:hypothetical protein